MGLVANRYERVEIGDFPLPDDFGVGVGNCVIEQEWYDQEAWDIHVLVRETRTVTNQDGREVSRTIDEYYYETLLTEPDKHYREVWALVWMPGITPRQDLVKVEEEWTYWFPGRFTFGERGWRKVLAGYVVYDLTPQEWDTDDGKATMEAQGRKVPSGTTRLIPDSGRFWRSALSQGAVVEKEGTAQRAVWRDPVSVEELQVDEDWQKVVRCRFFKDYLTPEPPDISREETWKDPPLIQSQLPLEAPVLKAYNAASKGVRLETEGGGSVLKVEWPNPMTIRTPPDGYLIYRRQLSEPGDKTDVMGIYDNDPSERPRITGGTVIDDIYTDFDGDPANNLPSQEVITEPEDPTPPEPPGWVLAVEVENQKLMKRIETGGAVAFDTDVEDGAEYEYYAVSYIADQISPESNHVKVTYSSGISQSRIGTFVDEKDGVIDVTNNDPDGGDTIEYPDVPAVVDPECEPCTGQACLWDRTTGGLITDACALGREIGLRNFEREKPADRVVLGLTMPLITLERGNYIRLPDVGWQALGNNLKITSRLNTTTRMVLEGFRYTWRMTESGGIRRLESSGGQLIAETP